MPTLEKSVETFSLLDALSSVAVEVVACPLWSEDVQTTVAVECSYFD